jgi:hypothetical protein
MPNKILSSLGLIMPDDFPSDLCDDINNRVSKNRDNYLNSWHQFAGGWNAVAYRFLSCTEYNVDFTSSIIKHGNSPSQPERYNQEKLLYNFFVTGLSIIESLGYALYAIGSIIDKNNFPISSKKDLKNIWIESTISKFKKSNLLKNISIALILEELTKSKDYKDWKDIRNILAHRSAPGRNIFMGGNDHGKVKWIKELQIDENTTSLRYKWLLANLKKLIEETGSFVSYHFKDS